MRLSIALLLAVAGFSQAHPHQPRQDDSASGACKRDVCGPLSNQGNKDACNTFCDKFVPLNEGLTDANAAEKVKEAEAVIKTFVDTVEKSSDEKDIQFINTLNLPNSS